MLETTGISKIAEFRYDQIVDDRGRKVPCTLFCRVYARSALATVQKLANPRDDIVEGQVTPSGSTDSRGFLSQVWWIVLLSIIIICAVAYFIWLKKPRNIQLGPITSSVAYGKRLYIGGEESGNNVLPYPGVPASQRIAVVEVGLNGKVIIRNEGYYSVSKGIQRDCVTLAPVNETITITDKRTGEDLYEIDARALGL